MSRADRKQLELEAAELAAEYAALRERLLITIEKTDQLGDDLLAEVERWTEDRKDDSA